ncbi:MAG: ShlB/FhaC/HecB family hemolysin secretion/activation protein [Spirochaetales bacterium]|nr:ShlB/FhaC/HecB family hemolysin secretion/activation protein [Spirochaetales bacterium]
MRKILLFAALLVTGTGLFADEAKQRRIDEIIIVQNEPVRTNEGALRRFLDLEAGQVYDSAEELEDAVLTQVKDLRNTRYFTDVDVVIEELESSSDELPVVITVTTTDGWTLVPIPYPIPDSQIGENGWQFGLEVTYDNVFGTMQDFYFDGFVDIAFGAPDYEDKLKRWKINPKLKEIDAGPFTLDIIFEQMYETPKNKYTDPLDPDVDTIENKYSQYYTKYTTALKLDAKLDITRDVWYKISPTFKANYGYDWRVTDGAEDALDAYGNLQNREDPFSFEFNHSINYGRVDWDGPYRNGGEVYLSNNNFINLSRGANASTDTEVYFITDLEVGGTWYKHFWKRLNYYTKGSALIAFNDTYLNLGDRLRGVENSTMSGNAGFFWQNTLAIQPFRERSGFNFQLHPFADVGAAFDYRDVEDINDILRFGAGSEMVFMVGSVDIRARFGYDFASGFIDFSFATGMSY